MATTYPAPAVGEVRWQPCFRVISSRFPPIDLFERVAGAQDWEALYWLESLTNPRLRDEIGEIELVAPEDRVFGPGASVIMAAFTHLNPDGSRFADSTFGAFYAAASLDTSIAETRYHREVFLRATHESPMEIDMRSYLCDVSASFHDIRGKRDEMPEIYDPDSYVASQKFARGLKLAKPVAEYSADLTWQGDAQDPGSTDGHIFYVIPYTYLSSVGQYKSYVDGYVIPQVKGWLKAGVLSRYRIYLNRYPVGDPEPWDVLFIYEYRSLEAFGRRDETLAAVRQTLRSDPNWTKLSQTKSGLRTESENTIAEALTGH